MTTAKRPGRDAASEGMRTFLDYWLYGVVKTSAELGNAPVFLRSVQEDSIRKLLENENLSFGGARDPVEVLRIYNEHLDGMGIIDAKDVRTRGDGDGLEVTVGASCPYRSVCDWIHDDGATPPCFRAVALSEVLRLASRRQYDGRLMRFDLPCHITLKPIRMEAPDDGS